MKKLILPLLSVIMLCLAFSACSSNQSAVETKTTSAQQASTAQKSETAFETITDMNEYTLYQNIFYNDQAADYTDKQVTKRGIFAAVYDEYNSKKRYYVWGYADNTKCCDWQWELDIEDESNLPPLGSTIEVGGEFKSNENALDGYWIENHEITVTSEFKSNSADVDMTVMGGTLERVQIINMQQFPDKFEGKTVSAYGRVETPTTIQHPYYDSTFSQEFSTTDTVPATGTVVIVSGKYSNGVIADSTITKTNNY